MATYVIGDINGDYSALMSLLENIDFDQDQDTLWFTGNLVGEHEQAPEVLDFVRGLGHQAITVLGEQELILLSLAEGYRPAHASCEFKHILDASQCNEILSWLRQWPLFHFDRQHNYAMVHAGLPSEWSLSQASTFSIEAETALGSGNHRAFFENTCGHPPRRWNAKLRGWKRLHFIVSAFTRLRKCTQKGYMDFGAPLAVNPPAEEYMPWHMIPKRANTECKIVFSGKHANTTMAQNVYPLVHGNVFENLPGLIKLPSVKNRKCM